MADNLGGDADRAWFLPCSADEENQINAWMFLAADVLAHGYAITGDQSWLGDYVEPCFNTASRDPFYAGDTCQYHSSKEVANTVPNGIVFLHFANGGSP
jgi:hypothetical protein